MMYWIRTHKGNAVNLAMAASLFLRRDEPGHCQLRCTFLGEKDYIAIAEGTETEMRQRLDELVDDLLPGDDS